MINIGLTLSLFGIISTFLFGMYYKKMETYNIFISYIIILLLYIFGLLFIVDDVKKFTLLDYENGNISYKVTEIRVEDNKVVDIEVNKNFK